MKWRRRLWNTLMVVEIALIIVIGIVFVIRLKGLI